MTDVRISITKIKFFADRQWFFIFKRYQLVDGFQIRLFGWHFNIREWNATDKLMQIWHANRTK